MDSSTGPKMMYRASMLVAMAIMMNSLMSAMRVSSTKGLWDVLVEPSGLTPGFWESGTADENLVWELGAAENFTLSRICLYFSTRNLFLERKWARMALA